MEPIRSPEEISRAHDLLRAAIAVAEIGDPKDGEDCHCLVIAADVLCWVLNHNHSTTFAAVLDDVGEAVDRLVRGTAALKVDLIRRASNGTAAMKGKN